MKGKRMITIAVLIVIVGLIVFKLLENKKELDDHKKPVDRSHIAVHVSVDTARKKPFNNTVALPATLIALEEGSVIAETSGRIEQLLIELGARVTQGQVVGRIDVKETQLKLEASELSITKLQIDYERNEALLQGNATNANTVSDSKYDLESKKLEAAQYRTQISKANILAPCSGTVTEKKLVAGEFVNTGSVIATVVNTTHLKARVFVPESSVMAVRIGQQATVTSEQLPGKKFSGAIIYISPKGDDNHNYQVELRVDNPGKEILKAGLLVNVQLWEGKQEVALQIPKIALPEGVKKPYVYIIENNKAVQTAITIGRENGEFLEVLSGLTEGQPVITSGLINIVPGSNVTAVQKH